LSNNNIVLLFCFYLVLSALFPMSFHFISGVRLSANWVGHGLHWAYVLQVHDLMGPPAALCQVTSTDWQHDGRTPLTQSTACSLSSSHYIHRQHKSFLQVRQLLLRT